MERKRVLFPRNRLFLVIVVLCFATSYVEGIRSFRRPPLPPPRPVVKVGNDVISLKPKPASVDIAPLLGLDENDKARNAPNTKNLPKATLPGNGLYVIRRKTPRTLNGFGRQNYLNQYKSSFTGNNGAYSGIQGNRRNYNVAGARSPLSNSKLQNWMAYQAALQRQRALKSPSSKYYDLSQAERKAQYYRSLLPLLYQYKLQKQAADKYYTKYLRSLQLLALATNQNQPFSYSPELSMYTQSFKNSPYGSLLNNSSFVATNSVEDIAATTPVYKNLKNGTETVEDQIADASASERLDPHLVHHHHHHYDHHHDEITSYHRELEKQKRRLLEVFPPPQAEVPFGERTILMVRFPPVPENKKKDIIKLKTTYDIDGGITFGGPRWLSFGKPFDPWDHPWDHTPPPPVEKEPTKYVWSEADKPSSYGVIISQNFIYRPSIRFTNSDPKHLAKNKGDLLNGGPSIVAQLAKALAEGNRISNSYFLSKNLHHGKKWASQETKPPFVIVHLDTYTKKTNETGSFGLSDDVEANYANGTIIYPTVNDPHILASTKFEFHDATGLDKIFDKPLAILGHGYGWGEVPVYPKSVNEIRNFLRLMYKVHQEAHDGGRKKVDGLKKLGDKLERSAFNDSKPLLRDQIADRSTNWLHTSSVGIRSLSEDDDHFPYAKHPVVDITKDYDHFLK